MNNCIKCGRPTINNQPVGPHCPECWRRLCIEETWIDKYYYERKYGSDTGK